MTLFTWILVALVAGWPAMYVVGVLTGEAGHTDKCRDIRSIAESTAILEAKQAGRRRVSQRRTAPDLPSPPSAANPLPSDPKRSGPRWNPQTPPAGAPTMHSRLRGATTADDIPPVIWTHDGTLVPLVPQAAPAKTGADDTGILTPVKLSEGATTGEIRAIGDRFVARLRGEKVS